MNPYQARAFIEQVMSSPNIYLAQMLVDANVAQLDSTFFQVLEAMIQEADRQGQFGSNLFSPNMPGVVADYLINSHAQKDQRAQGLRMLYQYAASKRQTNPAATSGATAPEFSPLEITCSGCGRTYPVICPGFGVHAASATVVATPQGGACTLCGAQFTYVTCACGALTYLNSPQNEPASAPSIRERGPATDAQSSAFRETAFNQSPSNTDASNLGDDDNFKELFGELQGLYTQEKSSGNMDDARQAGLDSLMQRLGDMINSDRPDKSLEEMTRDRGKLDNLMTEMLTRIKKPSLPGPELPERSRAEKVFQLLQERKAFIASENMKSRKSDGEASVAIDLFARLARLSTKIHQTQGDEQKLLGLETDQARQIVNEVRLFARRHYITLTQPDWSRGNICLDPNLIFVSAPDNVRMLVEGTARNRKLTVNPASRVGMELDEFRWQDLRAASLAVFDISERSPQVFYELGIALVLGTELLIIAEKNANIPFDVAQEVHLYDDLYGLRDFLSTQLEDSIYGLQSSGSEGSSLAATVAYAERLAAAAEADGLTKVALDSLRKVASDPIAVPDALQLLNNYLQSLAHIILYPRWPGCYPDTDEPRCFIVMPFDKKLDRAYQFIEEMCHQAKPTVTAVRGDVAEEGEIIKSIWDEIGRATHVTVDLTGFNPNVCLELGIANALGRNTLLIGREGTDQQLKEMLPNVAKRRCHTYPANPATKPQFVKEVTRFLKKKILTTARP